MESKRVKRVVILFVVIGFLLVQTEASFGDCYKGCLILCAMERKAKAFACPFACLKQCLIPSSTLNPEIEVRHYFCKLGCATSRCAELSSAEKPNVRKVEICVDSCSDTCTKKNE